MKNTLFCILLSALVTASHQLKNTKISETTPIVEDKFLNYRLPNNSKPHHYKIKLVLHIIPGNFTFDGESEISLEIVDPTKNLTLHASHLKIHDEESTLINGEEKITPNQHIIDKKRQFLTLAFSKDLLRGNYTLQLKYSGKISDDDVGLFRNSYKNDKNETVYLISTLFQPTFARQAFPCWDEPALKATFDISIKHFPNYTALSNMPMKKMISETEIDGKIWTDFQTTPVMSTYLVAFLVSDLKNYTNPQGNFSVWSRENPSDSMMLVYKTGLKVIDIMEKYTNIPYAFPKQDHAAVSRVVDAIENWGLITYKEEDVLQNKKFTTEKTLVAILLVAHEICHQWFGNLVSPIWWKHLWLNEGFAEYMQYFVVGKMMHEPRIIDIFLVTDKYEAYNFESNSSVLSLSPEVNTETEIDRTFDGFTYCKGASMVHMLRNFLSDEMFHVGVQKYLQAYKFKAAASDDLWKFLQDALNEAKLPHGNIDIKKIMDPYLQQRGYPVVNVIRNYSSGVTKLRQECLVCPKLNNDSDTESTKWWIPINFVTNSSLNFSSTLATDWMSPEEKELTIEGINPDDWVIFNKQSSGYYRVNYDETNWMKITSYLNSDNYLKIHVLNRLQLLEDAFYLFKEKKLDLHTFFKLMSYLVREIDYIPWLSAFRILNECANYLEGTPIYSSFKNYSLWLLDAVLNDVGFEENDFDDLFTLLKRPKIFYLACRFGYSDCQFKAKQYVLEVLKNANTDFVPPNFKDWVLCSGMEESTETMWNSMLDVYRKMKDKNILESLSCVKNKIVATTYLNIITMNDTTISDATQILNVLCFAFNRHSELTFDFITYNLEKIKERIQAEDSTSIFKKIINCTQKRDQLKKIKEFLKKNPDTLINNVTKPLILAKENEFKSLERLSNAEKLFENLLFSYNST